MAAVLMAEIFLRPGLAAAFTSPLPGLAITRVVEIVLLILIARYRQKSLACIGLAPEKLALGLQKGLVWSAWFGVAAIAAIIILHAVGVNALRWLYTPLPYSQVLVIYYLVAGGVVGPVAEEIFFRGILYGFFRRWGVYPALALSTLLFVLPHLAGGNLPLTQLVGGIVFAVAYEKAGSLLAPIIIHCLGNLAIFAIAFLA